MVFQKCSPRTKIVHLVQEKDIQFFSIYVCAKASDARDQLLATLGHKWNKPGTGQFLL